MADIFDVLNSVLYNKRRVDINIEDSSFQLFQINRWISMYSPEMCYFVNETSNFRIDKIFESKEEIYDFLLNTMPRLKYKKINYIKKPTKKTTSKNEEKELEKIEGLADNIELSQREIKEYLQLLEEFKNE